MKILSLFVIIFIISGCLGSGNHAPEWYIKRTSDIADQIEEVANSITVNWKNYQNGKISADESATTFDNYASSAGTILIWTQQEKDIAPKDFINITWEEGGAASLLNMSATHFSDGIRYSNDEYKHSGELDLSSGKHHLAAARELIAQDK